MKFQKLKKRSTRRSDGVRAPCSSSTTRFNQRKGRGRKRGGKGRKRRAGARTNQTKSVRLGKSNLRILYWNCRSLEQRGVVAEKLAYSGDIVCLQETKLGERKNFNVAGYQNPIYNRAGHGQLILVANAIKFQHLATSRWETENLHLAGVELQDQPVRNIINVYACNNSMSEADWLALDEMQRALPGETVFCGDFNARGSEWGNTVTNPQGIALEDALDHCDLSCINTGSMTRMASRDGDSDSVIDLAITTLNIASMSKWSVLDDHGSDHLPCTIHVKRRRSKRPPKRPKAFTYLNQDESLVSKIRQKAQTPTCQTKTVISQPPWWDPDIEELWKSKRKALRLAQRDNTNGNLKETAKAASPEFRVAAT